MGVYAICGVPGAGKTLYAIDKFLIPALKAERVCFTNIEGLNPYRLAITFGLSPLLVENNLRPLGRVYNDDGSFSEDVNKIRRFWEDEDVVNGSFFLIDEAQNYFSSRDFKEGYSKDLIPYITRHRHYGHDLIWVTQVLESVDISLRRNTALTYAIRRGEHLGMKKTSFVYVYDRADLERHHLSRSMYHFNSSLFQCYDSYVAPEVTEKRKSYNVLLRSPFVWFTLICIGIGLYILLSGGFSRVILKKGDNKSKQVKKTEQVQQNQNQGIVTINNGEVVNEITTNNCITAIASIKGNRIYTFKDNTASSIDSGFVRCPNTFTNNN